MIFFVFSISTLLIAFSAEAQSNLPACSSYSNGFPSSCYGKTQYPNGDRYEGEYRNGVRQGTGSYTYANGAKYVGEYKDGYFHGHGIEYTSTGNINRQGQWVKGKFIETVPEPTKLEIERLLLELETLKKKQNDLDEQLRISSAAAELNNKPTLNKVNERRVALVIGNAAYKFNPLKNPVNDSNDIARSLRAVGFDVIQANNTTLAGNPPEKPQG